MGILPLRSVDLAGPMLDLLFSMVGMGVPGMLMPGMVGGGGSSEGWHPQQQSRRKKATRISRLDSV